MVVRATVDLDKLHDNRARGVAPVYRDRRRRADLYRAWPSHLDGESGRKRRTSTVRAVRG